MFGCTSSNKKPYTTEEEARMFQARTDAFFRERENLESDVALRENQNVTEHDHRLKKIIVEKRL